MKFNKTKTIGVLSLLIITTLFSFKNAEDIKGWFLAGSAPDKYEIGTTTDATRKGKVAFLYSKKNNIKKEFGTLMQSFAPNKYLGTTVELTAYIKSENVEKWAGMWLRIDGKEGKTLGFDNMRRRPINGTKDWEKYSIILEVPDKAINIAYGVLLSGTGKVFIDDFKFTIVDSKAKKTGDKVKNLQEPTNTNFDN